MSFTNAQNETFQLLRGVNLAVEKGKITALVGGNGTGKTTLFNIISGFEKDYAGDVIFEDTNFNKIPAHRISLMGIGRLFQDGQLLPGLTFMENMKMASDDKTGEWPFSSLIHPKRWKETETRKEQQAKDILKRIFGEDCKYLNMLNDDASAFSYNPVYIDTIEKIIRAMVVEGLTVLLIEHNMHFVRKVADICAYLDDGIIEKIGSTAEVLDDKNVRNSYLGL